MAEEPGPSTSSLPSKVETPAWVRNVGIPMMRALPDRVSPTNGLLILSWNPQGIKWRLGMVPPYSGPSKPAVWKQYRPGLCCLCNVRVFFDLWSGAGRYKDLHRPQGQRDLRGKLLKGVELSGPSPLAFCMNCWRGWGPPLLPLVRCLYTREKWISWPVSI